MYSRMAGFVAGGLWVISAFAQTPPGLKSEFPRPGAGVARAFRQFFRSSPPAQALVCSIPLLEVPVRKDVDTGMKIFRPPQPVPPVREAPLPAPPCKEKQR